MYKPRTKSTQTKTAQPFEARLEFGLWAEQTLIPWIEGYFSDSTRTVSYFYNSEYEFKTKAGLKGNELIKKLGEYDLKFGIFDKGAITARNTIRFEVKTDKYEDTGNVIIKHRANGYLSGPFSTEAEYFIFFQPRFKKDNVYIIKSKKLVEMLNAPIWHSYSTKMTQASHIECFIIPKQLFDDEFIKIGGRIETHNSFAIPDKFNVDKFINKTTVTYFGDNDNDFRKLGNPFDLF